MGRSPPVPSAVPVKFSNCCVFPLLAEVQLIQCTILFKENVVIIAYWLRARRLRGRSSSPGMVENFLHVV
jgi:hypothetical protein